jgi:predicted ribosome quality control (RQC) complex YloA/Tae2 family protein
MPIDALFLSAAADELRAGAVGCRVDKVLQPERDAVVLQLRGAAGGGKLLLSASCNHPRAHFTSLSFENPAQPPMFCMLLRKHLTGGKLLSITQPPMERLLDFAFDCLSELGEPVQKHLILELMGRNSNLVLCGGDGRILDCLRRVDMETSPERPLLPGLYYRQPPARDKQNPLLMSEEALSRLLAARPDGAPFDKWLLDTFEGLSPLACREIAFRLLGDLDADAAKITGADLFAAFAGLRADAHSPTLLLKGGEAWDFYCLPVRQYGDFVQSRPAESFSALLDSFYGERDAENRIRQKTQALRKLASNLLSRARRKQELQKKELADTKDREHLRRLGDLVTANLQAIRRGQTLLVAEDFYDPDMKPIEIPLLPTLSPQQNAAKYYKDYQKAKNAEKILTEQLSQGEGEIAYLESLLDELSRARTEREIQEIRDEMSAGGYLRGESGKKRMRLPPSKPMEFTSPGGFAIFVGRNNRQNDLLTLKTAQKQDLWLHAQKTSGSHVIIACGAETPDDETMTMAAELAAYYSQAREGQNVPVDCTRVKNVKKPNGAKPGMVIYDKYTTLYVTPSPERIENWRETSHG